MAKKKISLEALKKASKMAHLQTKEQEKEVSHAKLPEIEIGKIVENPYQPRLSIDESELKELMESIRRHGLLQPLVVSRMEDGGYQLIAGHRRFEACKRLGKKSVVCVEVEKNVESDEVRHLLSLALQENIQRVDLAPLEIAVSLKSALDSEAFATMEELAMGIGKSKSFVSKVLSLLKLDDYIVEDLARSRAVGDIEALYMLQKIDDKKTQRKLYDALKNGEIGRKEIKSILQKGEKVSHAKPVYRIRKTGKKLNMQFNGGSMDETTLEAIREEIEKILQKYAVEEK
ncbi:ParB/RepB/Spo0J family partition protein [Hydrogenimonas cancrithermarum]|uniref:Chromosome partitioning protein ParB n=1 Tax=Hydrogenimonas cancrithermarum TaxID=2993563 RepID=A0ABM8FNP3_9BACT|nr:ParB/RepB/Spo0J family partition protein [Hydrogenimonas cancrithermarum]BDY13973.1 chromosome partitioning protein ParB [Hydrogenimonas cancrithermarum]